MPVQTPEIQDFAEFVGRYEATLRESLIAVCGSEHGRDAAAEALVYGWRHWNRIRVMQNPIGYLYKVGVSRGRRMMTGRRPLFDAVESARIPDVEPGLPDALARLSERQRTVVVLVHCFQWTQSEVGELLGLSKTTVQNHLERGMVKLRRDIGAER